MISSSASIWRAAAGALMAALFLTGTADAQTLPSPEAVAAALAAGGARLGRAGLQHADGGWWAFAADTTDVLCVGHAVPPSSTQSCGNLFGTNGLGLLEAFRHNPGNQTLLDNARLAGDALVGIFHAQQLAEPDPLQRQRPYTQDVEFLGALAQTTGNAVYMTTATNWFAIIVAQFPSAPARVDAIFAKRGATLPAIGLRTLGAWDAASLVRAARGVGNVDYAAAAATRIVERELDYSDGLQFFPGWKYLTPSPAPVDNNPYGYDLTFLAEGSLLMSLVDLPAFTAKRAEYRDYLLSTQELQGTWDGIDPQWTAYIVKGLIALGDPIADPAIARAENYFISTQQPGGGWLYYGTEYTEVDAEIMQALAALYNTPAGSNVTAQPSPLAGLQFSTVTTVGTTTVTAIEPATAGSVLGGYALATLAYDVSTTALFSGDITSCFWVPTITDPIAFANVRVTHAEGGTLVDRTILAPDAPAPNFATKTVCARTTTLSPFAVAVFHKKPPKITAPNRVVAEAAGPSGAVVTFAASALDPVDGVVPVTCAPASGSVFPLGNTIVTCSAANAAGKTHTASIIVRVRDTVDPVIDSVTPSASTLPASGAMVTVTLTVVADDVVDQAPSCVVTRVTSNVKDVDHNGVPGWSITGPLKVSLEAATKKHKDRTYRITVRCTDDSGNSSSEKTTVVVSRLP